MTTPDHLARLNRAAQVAFRAAFWVGMMQADDHTMEDWFKARIAYNSAYREAGGDDLSVVDATFSASSK